MTYHEFPEQLETVGQTWPERIFDELESRYAHLRGNEDGVIKQMLLARLMAGGLAVTGVAFVTPPLLGALGSHLGIREVVDVKNNHLKAEKIHAEDVHFDFRTVSVWAVEGQVGTRWTVFGKEIPGSGYGAEFARSDTSGTSTDPRSKVLLWTGSGNLNSDPSGPQVVVEVQGDKQIVKFPIDALVTNAQFSEADTKVVQADRTFTQGIESVTGLLGFASKTACNLVTLGKNQEGCSALFNFNAWANNNQAEVDQLLRYSTLEEVQKKCAPNQWTKEKALILKSFQDEGVKKGWAKENTIVEFVDKTGKETTAVPDYTHTALDGLKRKGILLKAPSGFSVQPVFSSISCSDATPKQGSASTPSGAHN